MHECESCLNCLFFDLSIGMHVGYKKHTRKQSFGALNIGPGLFLNRARQLRKKVHLCACVMTVTHPTQHAQREYFNPRVGPGARLGGMHAG